MKKNINKKNKAIALSLAGMGLMLSLGACSNVGANAATLSANVSNKDTKGNTTNISVDNNTVSINGDGASSEGNVITVGKAGNYNFTGTLDEGQIIVDADGDVNFTFNNFSISYSKDAPIVAKKGKLNIVSADGTDNKVSDKRAANTEDENGSNESSKEAYDAAIYGEADINLSGSGKLTVEGGYEDGIHSKSNLSVESGNYSVTASHHGLNGKKTLVVKNGTFDVTTVEDAFHSKGDVTVENGEININAGDDAVHADNTLTVKDGKINVAASNEGLEGITVNIEGGDITVNSSDDGVNAAGDTEDGSQASYAINISGGNLKVVPGGDGIDSNGDLNISGGNIFIDGPSDGGNAPVDYDGTATITGGSILATGNSGMFEGLGGNGSTQSSIIYYLDSNITPGSTIKLTDESGNEIFSSADQTQSYNAVLYSSDKLESGKKYDISVGDSKESVTLESGSNTVGNRQGGMGQPPQGGNLGGQHGGDNGDRQGQPPQMNGNDNNRPAMPPQGGNFGGPQGGNNGDRQSQPPQMDGNGREQGGMGQPPQGGPQGGGNGDRQGQPPQMNGNGNNRPAMPPQGGNFGGSQGGNNGDRQGQPPQMNGNGREQGGMGQPPQGGQKPEQAHIDDNQNSKNKSDSKKKKNKQKNNKNTENKSGKEQ